MDIRPEVSLGDVATVVGLLITGVGLFLNWIQLRKAAVQARAEFIVTLFQQYITDDDCAGILYRIEYGKFEYNGEFHDSQDERSLDRLLSYFEKIATLHTLGTVDTRDLELVRYDFLRVASDTNVQSYFATLDRFGGETGI